MHILSGSPVFIRLYRCMLSSAGSHMLCKEDPSILDCVSDLRAVSGVTHTSGSVLQVTLDFGLSQQVYAKAKVKDVTSVGLWLGADVMLDYPLEEAKQLLVNS